MAERQSNAAANGSEGRIPAILSLISGLLVIGFSPILLRVAAAPGPVSGFYRMAIGALVLTPWVIKRRQGHPWALPELRPAIFAGLFFGGDMVLWTTGVMLAGATIPTLFANTTPLWVGLGALVFFREKLKPGFWLGLLLAFAGAFLILGVGNSSLGHLKDGVFLGLGSALFYSSFFLAGQTSREKVDPLTFLWVVSLVSSLVLLLAVVILGQPLSGYSPSTYVIFLVMGVVIQVLGWWLISYAQGHLPASLVSPTMLGQPVLTALLAVPLLGEILRTTDILGGVAVIVGVGYVHLSKQKGKG